MMTNDKALDLIETALRSEPHCPCGETTTIVVRDGVIRLECRTLASAQASLRSRLAAVLAPTHVAREIVEDEIVPIAA